MLTSNSATDRYSRRTWWFVYSVWAVMTLQALVFIVRYPSAGPIADEWEFVPAVTGEEPIWPWLWQLHNEHRFPLPRLIWLPLTQITEDFRAGCYVMLAGVSGLALLMIRLARRFRGSLNFADAFFPISLLHVGHWENWQMGYQIVFMMNLVLAGILLWLILTTDRKNLLVRGVQSAIVVILLLLCGAGGLAFGPVMALWLIAIAAWSLCAKPKPAKRWRVAIVLGLTALIPLYIWLYLQGYERPTGHPDPVEVWGSRSAAAWQALRIGLQALSMAFGPAASGLWPASAFVVGLIGFECVQHLLRLTIVRPEDRPRLWGLLLFLGSIAFMAFGIGWGRCGFTDNGAPSDMGLASRYGWIVWPGLAAIYFQWLIFGGRRLSRCGPIVLFAIVVLMLPFNIVTGFRQGEKLRTDVADWEKSVRDDSLTDEQLIDIYYSGYQGYMLKRMQTGLYLLRKHHFQYYRPLPKAPSPPALPPLPTRKTSSAPRRKTKSRVRR